MTEKETIEIAFSKGRITKMLIGFLVFVLLGLWLIIYQPSISNTVFNSPIIKYGVAAAAILFFGFTLVYSVIKLVDKKPGLVIDKDGIFDNSTATAVGLIPWNDIKGVSTVKVMKQEFVVISVNNPDHYISKQKNVLKRKSMEYNRNNYGSPITISANVLNCDASELVEIIEKELLPHPIK